jgi:hypothetical protein
MTTPARILHACCTLPVRAPPITPLHACREGTHAPGGMGKRDEETTDRAGRLQANQEEERDYDGYQTDQSGRSLHACRSTSLGGRRGAHS